MTRLMHFTALFGPRFSRQRRIINIVTVLIVGVVLVWLWSQNVNHDTRITQLERSDCKESLVTGAWSARESCNETLDHADATRPMGGVCITFRRAKYPCPLTEKQARRLRAMIGEEVGR